MASQELCCHSEVILVILGRVQDWILLSIWSEGLHLRADTVELQCEQLLQQVVKLRKLLQHMESALKQFLVSREKTWMYYRAMAYVRSAPPPVPASVLEVLNIQVKEEIPEDEGDAFIAFARRYNWSQHKGPAAGGTTTTATISRCRKEIDQS